MRPLAARQVIVIGAARRLPLRGTVTTSRLPTIFVLIVIAGVAAIPAIVRRKPGDAPRDRTSQRGALLGKAVELVQLARDSGYNRAELLDIIEQLP